MTKPPQHVGAVGDVDACGLQDRGVSGDRITLMSHVLAAETGMVGIEQRQARRVIELGIGHHLVDISLRDALLSSVGDPAVLVSTPITWVIYGILAIVLAFSVRAAVVRRTRQDV